MAYDHGDTVLVLGLGSDRKDEAVGEIVAITEIVTNEQATALGHAVGTIVYTVEFGDGTDADVSSERLKPYSK